MIPRIEIGFLGPRSFFPLYSLDVNVGLVNHLSAFDEENVFVLNVSLGE